MDLTAAAALYGTTEEALSKLGAFESDVYSYEGPHGPSILKVMSPTHRTPSQVQGEVDWLLSLHEAGVPVALPLASERGEWVERLDEPERVLVAFRRAPGATTSPAEWTEARIEAWGELLGRLQTHGRSWTPPGPKRQSLLEHTYLTRFEVVQDDPDFVEAVRELLPAAERLLGAGPGTGLVHADLHHGNLLLHEERWTAIDFDDCGYGSFAFDLAMPLYYAVRSGLGATPAEAAERFVPPFLRGFRRWAEDPLGGAEAVALGLTIREAELVMALRLNAPDDERSERFDELEKKLRENVKQGKPVLEPQLLQRWLE